MFSEVLRQHLRCTNMKLMTGLTKTIKYDNDINWLVAMESGGKGGYKEYEDEEGKTEIH